MRINDKKKLKAETFSAKKNVPDLDIEESNVGLCVLKHI